MNNFEELKAMVVQLQQSNSELIERENSRGLAITELKTRVEELETEVQILKVGGNL